MIWKTFFLLILDIVSSGIGQIFTIQTNYRVLH